MRFFEEEVRKENVEACLLNNSSLKDRSFGDIILETYVKYVEKINDSGKIIGSKNGYPVIYFELSFNDILKNYKMYGLYFNKKHSNNFFRMIFTCGGACAIKLNDGLEFQKIKYENAYVIIINKDNLKLLSEETRSFIESHEFAHIQNDNCENEYDWKGDEEFLADFYAKTKGYRISTSVLNMTRWETNSYHYIGTSKNFFTGLFYNILGFFKHYARNVKRRYY